MIMWEQNNNTNPKIFIKTQKPQKFPKERKPRSKMHEMHEQREDLEYIPKDCDLEWAKILMGEGFWWKERVWIEREEKEIEIFEFEEN